jgi:ZIP family zinc transporter
MPEAFDDGGFDAVLIGFLAGGLIYIFGDYLIHKFGGRKHMRRQIISPKGDATSGRAITMGAILDGVPESIALGITLASGSQTGLLLAAAILLSNFPEGISSVEGLTREGFSKKTIYLIWGTVGVAMALITVLSFVFLSELSANTLGIIIAFAGGAILAMLADTMMPEAYEEGGFSIGIATILGFLTAFFLSRL